jgi:hypothetical protein
MVPIEFQKIDYELTMSILNILKSQFEEHLKSINCNDIQDYEKYINNLNTDKESEYIELYENAYNLYKHVATFPSEEGIHLLKKIFSLKNEYLTWITDFKTLIKEVEKINEKNNIYVSYSYVVLVYYVFYMPTKIRNKLLKAFKFETKYDGKEKNNLEIYLFKLNQNLKNRAKKGYIYYKNEAEEIYRDLLLDIKSSGLESLTKNDANKILNSEASGNIENIYLHSIIRNSVPIIPIKENEKLRAFFHLYRLILREDNWKSEDEFYSTEKFDKNFNPIGLYENNYNRYMEVKMRNFLRNS